MGRIVSGSPTHCFHVLAVLAELMLMATKPFFLSMETTMNTARLASLTSRIPTSHQPVTFMELRVRSKTTELRPMKA